MNPLPKEFRFSPSVWPDLSEITTFIGALHSSQPPQTAHTPPRSESTVLLPENFVMAVAHIATNAWRAKLKMIDRGADTPKDDMKRVYRHIEAIFDGFKRMGIDIIDNTGDVFDPGMALKVISWEYSSTVQRDTIIETVKPSIRWDHRLVQVGEVVVQTTKQ